MAYASVKNLKIFIAEKLSSPWKKNSNKTELGIHDLGSDLVHRETSMSPVMLQLCFGDDR